ncbi:hypothetical protein V6N12_063019 [Hibiscus sabdariffa]|uniref:Uncharacterized protein n=1 Tax=Hibiscus sabdariffa TaxID=183260 RepID=A0ABR2FAL3_9ROSI
MDHILCHCTTARGLWCRLILPEFPEEFMLALFDGWLRRNLGPANVGSVHGNWWGSRFPVCSVILASKHTSREDILARGNRLVDECMQVLSDKPLPSASEALPEQLWSHPTLGWVKGNVGATVHIGNGQDAIGGLITDEHGDWIVDFTRPEAETFPSPLSSLVAEIDKYKGSSNFDSMRPQDWFGITNTVCFNLHADHDS